MRISDWSSDVCSSDLFISDNGERQQFYAEIHRRLKPGSTFILLSACYDREGIPDGATAFEKLSEEDRFNYDLHFQYTLLNGAPEIGRASCRERVCQSV